MGGSSSKQLMDVASESFFKSVLKVGNKCKVQSSSVNTIKLNFDNSAILAKCLDVANQERDFARKRLLVQDCAGFKNDVSNVNVQQLTAASIAQTCTVDSKVVEAISQSVSNDVEQQLKVTEDAIIKAAMAVVGASTKDETITVIKNRLNASITNEFVQDVLSEVIQRQQFLLDVTGSWNINTLSSTQTVRTQVLQQAFMKNEAIRDLVQGVDNKMRQKLDRELYNPIVKLSNDLLDAGLALFGKSRAPPPAAADPNAPPGAPPAAPALTDEQMQQGMVIVSTSSACLCACVMCACSASLAMTM